VNRNTTSVVAAVIAVLAVAPVAVAQDLNPPAPDFYSCKASGQQTICQANRTFAEDPYDTEIACDGFTIWDQGTVHQVARRFYNADGDLVRRVIHETWDPAHWSNPLNGETVPYHQNGITTQVFGVPADFDTVTETVVGSSQYQDPETGTHVLREAGRIVHGPAGDIEFYAGMHPFTDYFELGDQTVFDAVCAALES
jgi:hypothetical protein